MNWSFNEKNCPPKSLKNSKLSRVSLWAYIAWAFITTKSLFTSAHSINRGLIFAILVYRENLFHPSIFSSTFRIARNLHLRILKLPPFYLLTPNKVNGNKNRFFTNEKERSIAKPRSLNGKITSQIKGYSKIAITAKGQHKTARINQSRKLIIVIFL